MIDQLKLMVIHDVHVGLLKYFGKMFVPMKEVKYYQYHEKNVTSELCFTGHDRASYESSEL